MSEHQTDPEFVQFDTMSAGVRALAKTLLTYYRKYNLDTVSGMIGRWAPPSENNTKAYIVDVMSHLPFSNPDTGLNMEDRNIIQDVVEGIIDHENFRGASYGIQADIITGVAMALGA